MTSLNKQDKGILSRMCTAASIALIGVAMAGCSAEEAVPSELPSNQVHLSPSNTATAPNPAADAAATATPGPGTAGPVSAAPAAPERRIKLQVRGDKSGALVKALVVTSDGKESGGQMLHQSLPFSQDLTLPANTTFTKILVLGKYPNGETGSLSCSVTIDGMEASANSSSGHTPAECLFVDKKS